MDSTSVIPEYSPLPELSDSVIEIDKLLLQLRGESKSIKEQLKRKTSDLKYELSAMTLWHKNVTSTIAQHQISLQETQAILQKFLQDIQARELEKEKTGRKLKKRYEKEYNGSAFLVEMKQQYTEYKTKTDKFDNELSLTKTKLKQKARMHREIIRKKVTRRIRYEKQMKATQTKVDKLNRTLSLTSKKWENKKQQTDSELEKANKTISRMTARYHKSQKRLKEKNAKIHKLTIESRITEQKLKHRLKIESNRPDFEEQCKQAEQNFNSSLNDLALANKLNIQLKADLDKVEMDRSTLSTLLCSAEDNVKEKDLLIRMLRYLLNTRLDSQTAFNLRNGEQQMSTVEEIPPDQPRPFGLILEEQRWKRYFMFKYLEMIPQDPSEIDPPRELDESGQEVKRRLIGPIFPNGFVRPGAAYQLPLLAMPALLPSEQVPDPSVRYSDPRIQNPFPNFPNPGPSVVYSAPLIQNPVCEMPNYNPIEYHQFPGVFNPGHSGHNHGNRGYHPNLGYNVAPTAPHWYNTPVEDDTTNPLAEFNALIDSF